MGLKCDKNSEQLKTYDTFLWYLTPLYRTHAIASVIRNGTRMDSISCLSPDTLPSNILWNKHETIVSKTFLFIATSNAVVDLLICLLFTFLHEYVQASSLNEYASARECGHPSHRENWVCNL